MGTLFTSPFESLVCISSFLGCHPEVPHLPQIQAFPMAVISPFPVPLPVPLLLPLPSLSSCGCDQAVKGAVACVDQPKNAARGCLAPRVLPFEISRETKIK